MIKVVSVHPFDIPNNVEDTDHWACYEWPQQTIVVGGVGGPFTAQIDAEDAFIAAYNSTKGLNLTAADFQFFGPMLASAEITQMGENTWQCSATADRPYNATGATLEEAKSNWLELYNTEYMIPNNNMTITDVNVDWIMRDE